MDSRILLDKQGKDEIRNMFSWSKKSKKTLDLSTHTQSGHCNNYASHCCLSCGKCWGTKHKAQK